MRKRMRGPSSVGGAAQGFDDALATSFLVFSIGPIGITTRASRMRPEIVVFGIRTRLYLCRRAPVLAGSTSPGLVSPEDSPHFHKGLAGSRAILRKDLLRVRN